MNANTEPEFVTDADRHIWETFSDEKKQSYIETAEYMREEYPDIPRNVVSVGSIMLFGF